MKIINREMKAKETKAIFNLMRVINGETSLPF